MKERITELLLGTRRSGMPELLDWMDRNGFFTSPCSGGNHLAKEGGLAEHSLNVLEAMRNLYGDLSIWDMETDRKFADSCVICALLHDLGKCGDHGKPGYVPNMLKGRATKANPNPAPVQSEAKPFEVNKELAPVDHEILWHNGLYGNFRYQIPGKETPLYMLLHFADMWASRVMEKEDRHGEP